jgi:hypothetical protein
MMKGEKEAAAAVTKMLEEQMSSMKAVLDVRSDHTWTAEMSMGAMRESTTGTWSAEGSTIVLTAKTKNGKPATGDDAKPLTLTLKDGRLEGKTPEGEPVAFKR